MNGEYHEREKSDTGGGKSYYWPMFSGVYNMNKYMTKDCARWDGWTWRE